VICLTRDCKYMRGCIQVVWEQRVAEVEQMARYRGELPLPKVKKLLRLKRKKDGDKL
jgi:hypothetical protein